MNTQVMERETEHLNAALEPLLTIDEAAHIVRRSHWTLRKYIADGSLASVRIGHGRDLFIEPAELRRFINKGKN